MIIEGEVFVEPGTTLQGVEFNVVGDLRVQGELDVGSFSSSRDPVNTVVAVLDAKTDTDFTNSKPVVFRYDETTVRGRENEADDAVYVVSLGGTTLTRFGVTPGAEDTQQEEGQLQIMCTSLTQQNALDIAEDVTGILRGLQSDNFDTINHHRIEPTDITDNRAQQIARMTDHFIYVVEVATERLAS
jgi:hypothetical protein